MPEETTDNFVEIDGEKFKVDPKNEGEALTGEDGKFIPFEEEEAPEETPEEKTAREETEAEAREPKFRKSAKDHIIERKNRQLEKEKKKNEDPTEEPVEDPIDLDDEITTAGKKAIDAAVKKVTDPFIEGAKSTADDQELNDVFAEFPESKKMEKDIRKYMNHSAYKDVPIKFIYLGLAKMEADRQVKRNKADEEANTETTGGHGKRNKALPKIPDVRGMNAKEFEKHERDVEAGFQNR